MNQDARFSEPMQRLDSAGYPRSLGEIEREHILFALEYHRWIVARAARSLNMCLPTLYERLRGYGVDIKKVRKEALK